MFRSKAMLRIIFSSIISIFAQNIHLLADMDKYASLFIFLRLHLLAFILTSVITDNLLYMK